MNLLLYFILKLNFIVQWAIFEFIIDISIGLYFFSGKFVQIKYFEIKFIKFNIPLLAILGILVNLSSKWYYHETIKKLLRLYWNMIRVLKYIQHKEQVFNVECLNHCPISITNTSNYKQSATSFSNIELQHKWLNNWKRFAIFSTFWSYLLNNNVNQPDWNRNALKNWNRSNSSNWLHFKKIRAVKRKPRFGILYVFWYLLGYFMVWPTEKYYFSCPMTSDWVITYFWGIFRSTKSSANDKLRDYGFDALFDLFRKHYDLCFFDVTSNSYIISVV